MPPVMTVTGPVEPAELGITLPHEHVFIDLLREYRGDGLLNDGALAIREVAAFADAGGRTIVDVTSEGLGRAPEALKRVSEETGVRIVMGSGHYREPYLDRARIDRMSVNALADEIVHDLEVGVEGTDVRAGVIGEIACDRYLTAAEERCFRAAARAHKRTGVDHHHARRALAGGPGAAGPASGRRRGPAARDRRPCDTVPDPAYHLELAKRGAFVQFDTIQGESEYDTRNRINWIKALVTAGFEDRGAAVT